MKKKKLVEQLEKTLHSIQNELVLVEEAPQSQREDASPDHVRENEKKIIGNLGHYDHKSVQFAEYWVNLCSLGVQNTLSK